MTGKDTLTTRKLYQDEISFVPQFNLFLMCNDKPDIPKLGDGIGRRLRVIDYPFKFVDHPKNPGEKHVNKKRKAEFKNDEELKDGFIQLLFQYGIDNINKISVEEPPEVKASA